MLLASSEERQGSDSALGEGAAEEEALIRRVQAGELDAFDGLVRRHLNRVYSVAFRVLWDRADAEDAVQESFLSALDHIGSFEAGHPFGPWVYRIAMNRALSMRRSRGRRRTDTIPGQIASSEPSPLLAVVQADVFAQLRAALAELPERQRVSFELHELDGFSVDEVARMFGVNAGTVRWHIHQARHRLRQAMQSVRNDAGAGYG
ncbi:MAG TPA: RNA polymerase sigma factor [Gemmatimonadales bacterium]|nr:RNA polymerase sigma factor [Gemmatimonadales bacterium]